METSTNYNLSTGLLIKIATLLTPILYLVGYFFHSGYLAAFNVGDGFFKSSPQEYMVDSFIVFVYWISDFWEFMKSHWKLSLCAFLSASSVLYAITMIIIKNKTKTDKLMKAIKNNDFYSVGLEFSTKSIIVLWAILFLIYFAVLTILIPIYAYKLGKSKAETLRTEYVSCLQYNQEEIPTSQSCVTVDAGNSNTQTGVLAAISDERIAIWDGRKTTIFQTDNKAITITQGKKGLQIPKT